MDEFWLNRTTTLPEVGWGIVRSVGADGRNRGECQQGHKHQRNQKPTHGAPTMIQIPRTRLNPILMTGADSVKERRLAPQRAYCTIGWAMIQRLITVYITISANMGYWLLSAVVRFANVLIATRCAR